MKKILIYIIWGIFVLQSCNNFLDIQPKGYTIPSTYEDYRRLMNDDQMGKAQEDYPCLLTDDPSFSGGDSLFNYTALSDNRKYLYSFAHGPIFNQGENDPYWLYSYNRIYVCNTVINNVMNSTDATEADKLMLKAEASVARAFEYLCLIGVYAPAYDPATASKDYGIPLVTSEDVADIKYSRATVEEVYERIKNDLDEAVPYLLDKTPNSFRPAKNVAYGFLSRMYLMRGEYDKALENAQASLKISEELVNLNEYMAKPGTVLGRIVRKNNTAERYPEGMSNPENIYVRYSMSAYGLQMNVYASKDLLDAYAQDLPAGAVDKRRALWFCDNNFIIYSFPGYSLYCPTIRANLALNNMEIILTAAECYVRIGGATNLQEAARLYNLLRDNRIENNTHVTFSNAEEALRKVLDERRREFAFLGTYRLVDLKRLNKDPRFAKTITHRAGSETWTLPANDNRYIFPLPPIVKDFRPDLPDYER